MKLYELTNEWARLQNLAEDGEDVATELATVEGAIEKKAENISAIMTQLDSNIDALKAEEDRLSLRRKAMENNKERLREYIKMQMEVHGMTRVKTPLFTWTLSDGPERVVVVNEEEIPSDFFRVKREVAKTDILKAWKEHGECVPGTTIERSKTLRVR